MSVPLIPPDVRARLKTLRLRTRIAPDGQGLGLHASRNRGAGLEFAQYRAYEPGDELRSIDWKLYARSDRYFVRDATRDSPLTVWLLIDTSASMAQGDAARPGYSRLDAAKALAACIAEIALQQGDRFGVVAAGGLPGISAVAAGAGLRHRDRLQLALQALRAEGQVSGSDALRALWERIPPASLVVLLSDGFDDGLLTLCEQFARARREIVSIQLLTAEERDFPFHGGHRFRDAELGSERRVDAETVREDFLARFADARAALARRMAASGIRHVEHVLDAPLDQPLRHLFGSRRTAFR